MISTRSRWSGRMMGLAVLLASLVCACGLSAEEPKADSIAIDGHIHTPKEIVTLMDRSILMYELQGMPDTESTPAPNQEKRVFDATRYVIYKGDEVILKQYDLSDALINICDSASEAFHAGKADEAIALYRRGLALDSTYYGLIVFIGDGFYVKKQYDSAIAYFRLAIEKNFIDYQAHWFLADALQKSGDTAGSVREATIAHVLNFYHQSLKDRMVEIRSQSGHPWRGWSYEPRYRVFRNPSDSHKIEIQCDTNWVGYALVKAIWKFEPGYAEKMLGHVPNEGVFNTLEEKEGLVMQAVKNYDTAPYGHVIEDGYVSEFIFYEILAREHPTSVASLPRGVIERMAEYVETYH